MSLTPAYPSPRNLLGGKTVVVLFDEASKNVLGLLALRSAMRLAGLGAPFEPITLRHGRDELAVGVHAMPDTVDGLARVLLSLRPASPDVAASAAGRLPTVAPSSPTASVMRRRRTILFRLASLLR